MPENQPEPAHTRRGSQHQGHGVGAREPPHGYAYTGALCPADWQGLRLGHHVGQTHSRVRLVSAAATCSSGQTHHRCPATQANETWHVDTTIFKLLDGTTAYLHAVIDNYSRKILAWTVAARLEPTATCQLLLAAGRHLVFAGRPLLYADSGIENVSGAVEVTLLSACLDRVLAQVDVAFSNSMIEAFWRSLKHQWLYLNSLDSIERLRALVEFYVDQHNTQMPHAAFHGQTPDEMYFGTAANLPAELAAAREQARAARLAANRAMSCDRCLGQQASIPVMKMPP